MKSAIFYTLTGAVNLEEELLSNRVWSPCGDHTLQTKGFIEPLGKELLYTANGKVFGKFRFETKDINTKAVEDALNIELDDCKETGQELTKGEIKDLKHEVTLKLLPTFFTKIKDVSFILDTKKKLFIVVDGSKKQADTVTEVIRECLETFPVKPLQVVEDPLNVMTDALLDSTTLKDTNITLGENVVLEDDEGNKISWKEDLHSANVSGIIEEGKTVSKMSVEVDGMVTLTVDQDISFTGIKISTALLHKAEEGEDPLVVEEGNMIACADEIIKTKDEIVKWFGGELS